MEKTLNELKDSRTLCAIYSDYDETDKFSVGYIIAVGEYAVVEMFDPYGHYDGIGCFVIDTVYHAETDTEYLRAMDKLIRHYKESCAFAPESVCNIDKILEILRRDKRICDISLCESRFDDITGIVDSFDSDKVNITAIGDYGENDGNSVVRRAAITFLSFDSTDTTKLEILRKE